MSAINRIFDQSPSKLCPFFPNAVYWLFTRWSSEARSKQISQNIAFPSCNLSRNWSTGSGWGVILTSTSTDVFSVVYLVYPISFRGGGRFFLGYSCLFAAVDRAYAEVNIWIPKIIFSVTPQGLPWGAIGFWAHVSSLSHVRWEMPRLSLSTQTLKFFLIAEKTDCCVFWLLLSIR